ncbi:DegT/DnrJ/EryC1/StrS aminotransferase family protein [bacterium]|nr:MAG: DegT/DnrJ/EryC1/StrS aminotransferase family protein [bacterium]
MKIDIADFIFTGRGSTALWSILKSLNRPDAKVLLPVNICEIVYPIVKKADMVPVLYDVNEFDGIAKLENIKDAFTGNESVLLAVHNFGLPLDIDKISAWAVKNNLFMVEDVCNSLGGKFYDKPLGSWGDASIFSFGYAKIIEHGFGGAAFVKDKNLKKKVEHLTDSLETYSEIHRSKDSEFQKQLRDIRLNKEHPAPSTYVPLYENYSDFLLYKIDAQAKKEIVARMQTLEQNVELRAKKASIYRTKIRSNKVRHIDHKEGQIYWRYNLLVDSPERQDLIGKLRENNLLVSTWYPPIAELFEENVDKKKYHGSYRFRDKVVNLFVDHRVTESDISKTIDIINGL